MKLVLALIPAALVASALCGPATAQSPPPFATTKVDGTDNIYIFRNGNAQAMFIVTKDGVIATDPIAYGKPTGGQTYLDEIRKITDKPVKYVVYSHHHYDHIAGGKAFKDAGAIFIAQKHAKDHLVALQDPNTVIPDQTFGDNKVIKLGGTTLELLYLGPNHSDSNIVMRLPKERIIFLVDTIPVGQVPGRGMIDYFPLESEAFIKKVIALDWDRMIPGHPGIGGRLGTHEDAKNILAMMQDASAEMKPLGQDGKCWNEAEKEFKMAKYADWPGYEAGLPFIARRFCLLWGRGT
jgi:glyoxylase-like metal-dependent hydrolase (beta-lactamase superfamily II)